MTFLLEWFLAPGAQGSTGGTLYMFRLAEALARHLPVTVLTFKSNFNNGQVVSGIRIYVVSESSKLRGSRVFNWKREMEGIVDSLPRGSILVTCSATNAALSGKAAEPLKKVCVVQAYEDFGLGIPGGSIKQRFAGLKRSLFSGQMVHRGIESAEIVLVNSRYVGDAVKARFRLGGDVEILFPPLDLVPSIPGTHDVEALSSVGFVNRSGKNLRLVLDLAEQLPDLRFKIFGHPLLKTIHAPSNCHLKGWCSDRENMYSSASTWIVPSNWAEPFGLVAIEALSQGCQVGVSDIGGLGEAVEEFGAVLPVNDLDAWQEWLQGLNADSAVDSDGENSQENKGLLAHLHRFGLSEFESKVCDVFERFFPEESTNN